MPLFKNVLGNDSESQFIVAVYLTFPGIFVSIFKNRLPKAGLTAAKKGHGL